MVQAQYGGSQPSEPPVSGRQAPKPSVLRSGSAQQLRPSQWQPAEFVQSLAPIDESAVKVRQHDAATPAKPTTNVQLTLSMHAAAVW
jgi:hypothetical protein